MYGACRRQTHIDLGENEIEIGIGIHGEPGQRRITMVTLDEMTSILAGAILDRRRLRTQRA